MALARPPVALLQLPAAAAGSGMTGALPAAWPGMTLAVLSLMFTPSFQERTGISTGTCQIRLAFSGPFRFDKSSFRACERITSMAIRVTRVTSLTYVQSHMFKVEGRTGDSKKGAPRAKGFADGFG